MIRPKEETTLMTFQEGKQVPFGTVHFLNAVRIPANHHKMVRIQVKGPLERELLLFTPCPLKEQDTALEESTVKRNV